MNFLIVSWVHTKNLLIQHIEDVFPDRSETTKGGQKKLPIFLGHPLFA